MSTSLYSQSPYLRFRHLQQENGLKNSSIHSICQDDNGFIWIGTEGGLFKYDGLRFKTFVHNPNDANSLNSNVVFALHNENNKLWIGTYRGLMVYDQSEKTFKDLGLSEKYLPGQTIPVKSIVKSPNGEIWIGCQDIGVVVYNQKSGEFDPIKASRINKYVNKKAINTILFDSNNNCWIGTMSEGVLKYRPGKNHPVHYDLSPYSKGKLNCNDIIKIYESKEGDIWIATRGGGVFQLDQDHRIINHFTHNSYPNSIGSDEAYDFWENPDGQLWISTNGGGLNIYDSRNNNFKKIKHVVNDKYSLINDNIRELYEDFQGNLWIASFQGGINVYVNNPYKFNHFYFPPDGSTEYSSSTILSFYAEKNTIWAGTDGGGLKKINKKTGDYITYLPNHSGNGIPDKVVTKIYKDYQGYYWFGTYLGGLTRFNEETGEFNTFAHHPDNESSLSHNYIADILEDRLGNFWVGTNGGGLNLLNKSSGKFIHLTFDEHHPNNSLATNYITCLQEDFNGDIWVGTYWGLSCLNIRNFKFTNHRFKQNSPGSLSNNVVLSLYLDSRNRIWVGTRMGLNLFDREKNSFTIYSENDGLAGSSINGILEDEIGNIWVSTNNGLSKFNPITGEVNNFYEEDGLQGNEFYHGACYQSDENEFFFGGYNGFNFFYPDSILVNYFEPDVILTGLRVLENDVPIGKQEDGSEILSKTIAETDKLELKYSYKNFTLDFAAIDFIEGEKNIFAFKLVGFDDNWRFTTPEHPFATYTNLSPGSYIFKVRAGKPEIINEISKYTQLEINITPPIWRMWWAYIVYLIILAFLVFYFWRQSIQRIKEKNQIKMEKLRREQVESASQARMKFYTNISHDIRTPLTLIIGPLEKLLSKDSKVVPYRKQLDIMLKNARRLLRLIDQLLDFRKIEMQKMKLKAQKLDIVAFVCDIAYSFEEFAVEKQIEYKFEKSCNKSIIWFDPDKIDKTLFNLISNAFKYTPEKGQITIGLRSGIRYSSNQDIEYVEITVSDTGKGIHKEDFRHIFDRFYQGSYYSKDFRQGWGLGLSLSKNYIELHKGALEVESVQNKGTRFKIYLPQGDSHISEHDKVTTDMPGTNQYVHQPPDLYHSSKQNAKNVKEKLTNHQKSLQLLIVEDNIDLRDFLIDELGSHFNCFEANNGKEGIEMALEIMPDIIISDVMMPETNGLQLCKSLKQNILTCHIPIILLTAKTGIHDQVKGFGSGADAYVSKPFSTDQLIANMNSLLENRQRLREKFGNLRNISQKGTKDTPDSKFLNRATGFIHENLENGLFGVNELANELGMSRVHLHRKIKAITGVGPNEIIRKIRLQKAVKLLLKKELSIAEICDRTGFNSTTYFSKCFKNMYNISPKEFAEKGEI